MSGVASGPSRDELTRTRAFLTKGQCIGGTDPVRIGGDKIAFFIVKDFAENKIEVRTAELSEPGKPGPPVTTYTMFTPRYRHTAVHLDRDIGSWFMYQATDRPEDGNKIIVRTAPVRYITGEK